MPLQVRVPQYERYFKTTYPLGFSDGYPVAKRYQEGWKLMKGSPRAHRPTPYLSRWYEFQRQEGSQVAPGVEAPIWSNQINTDEQNACRQKAYDKLKAQVNRAELGTGFAEISQSVEMVTGRCKQLFVGFNALRNGDVKKFAKTFSIKVHPKHRRLTKRDVARQSSGLWLEYWMGWAPTVGDIYNALEVATGPLPPMTIRGSSGFTKNYSGMTSGWGEVRNWNMDAFIRCGYKATLVITNPNLALLNQFGLANPVKTFYDLMPFSFMLEWFVNLGSVLSSFADWLGFDLTDAETNTKYGAEGMVSYTVRGVVNYKGIDKAVTFTRTLGLQLPKLGLRRFNGLSMTRGATSISLLISLFLKRP